MDAREIFETYLKYHAGEAFLFGTEASFKENRWLWYPTSKDDYSPGEIIKTSGSEVTIKLTDGSEKKMNKNKVDDLLMNPPKFDGVEDCAHLGNLNEPGVLQNLRKRYDNDIIYTYSGLFLVVLNPYKLLPIYNPCIVDMYIGKRRSEMPPHVYAISDTAYRNMLNDRRNQSILITGESGAGKTENTKKVIQYMALIAGKDQGEGLLEKQIIQANPILESFGNAKTLKNNNSSRFGKLIEIQFNSSGFLSGASILSYLLEKSRVVKRLEGERTFHFFYQILADPKASAKYHLEGCKDYKYIANSECFTVPGWDETQEYNTTIKAFEIMKFDEQEIGNIHGAIAGILHLGNISFETTFGEGCGVSDKSRKHLDLAAEVLKVNGEKLEAGLCTPRIRAGREWVQTHLNVEKASYNCQSLAMGVYHRVFLWIVKKINMILSHERAPQFIGVLDISGFEIFKYNSFEQLCINYTNEKLQQFFNHHMFVLEQEEYMAERIEWTMIDFGLDLQPTIDLIEKRPVGILALLDDQTLLPKASDLTFVSMLHSKLDSGGDSKYIKPRFSKTAFGISHYAGDVEYETQFWLDKNKDPIAEDLIRCFAASEMKLIEKVFSENITGIGEQKSSGSRGKKSAMFVTVSMQYKQQLAHLMKLLYSTHPHFIRCIIPNHKQQAGFIDDPIVLDQLRCNGVLEGIRISRKGFPNRIVYPEFLKRYYLLGKNIPRNTPDPRGAVAALLDELKVDPEKYRFGVTKVFFRAGQLSEIEEMREKKIGEMLITIQAAARGFLARQLYKR